MNISTANPFVGLRPFESGEDLLFFGRKEQVLELMQRLHKNHFVAVIGSSGSGKSSLIKAGLIPGLQAGYLLNDSDRWLIASMKPGQDPLNNLAEALLEQAKGTAGILTSAALVKSIQEEGTDALLEFLQPLWKDKFNFFLLVDQFEELFRFSTEQQDAKKKDDAIEFVNTLLDLSQQKDLPVHVVITMRSDFIGDCTQFFGLPEALNQSQYLVPRLNRTQLKTTIEGPVKLFNGKISPILTARLLNDVQIVKDELPLLQHALMRTWDYEMKLDKNGELDIKDYESIGGIEKALSNHADEALSGMSEHELSVTKKIFQALTTIDENGRKIRKPVTLKGLEAITGEDKTQLLLLINRFIEDNRSFLVLNKSGDDILVDISHESLIRQWSTLSGWVDEEAESAKMYLRLVESATLFHDKKKDLLTGSELQLALQWYADFKPGADWGRKYNANYPTSIQYLQQSEKVAKRKKNNKKILLGGVIIGLATIVFVLFFAYQKAQDARDVAEHAQKRASKSASLAKYSDSLSQIEKFKAEKSASIAKHSDSLAQVARINAENQTVIADIKTKEAITQKDANVKQLARNYWNISQTATAKNNLLEAGYYASAAINLNRDKSFMSNILVDIEPVLPQTCLEVIFDNFFKSAVVSPDGKQILTTGSGYAQLWDLSSRDQIGPRMEHENVKIAIFSPDGKRIVTASDDDDERNDGAIQLWDAALGKKTGTLMKHDKAVTSAVFSADGRKLLTASKDGTARLWDTETGLQIGLAMKHAKTVNRAIFSHNGKLVITASEDSTACLWDASSGTQIGPSIKHRGAVNTAVFNQKETLILTASRDSTARLWDVSSRQQIGPSMKHEHTVNTAVFNHDGKRILTASSDNTARLWDAASGKQIGHSMEHNGPVETAVFSPDEKRILTVSLDQTARLWEASSGNQIGPSIKGEGFIYSAFFSPDGKRIITVGRTTCIWTLASTKLIIPPMKLGNVIKSAVFDHNGKRILTASDDGTARLWDASSGKQVVNSMKHEAGVISAAFSPDGTRIVTASYDNTARIWDALTGMQIGHSMEHEKYIYSAVFSPSGKQILTSGYDVTARLWDASSGKQLTTSLISDGLLVSAVYSPDGKKILTAIKNHSAQLWNAETGKEEGAAMEHENIGMAIFSPDGERILTASVIDNNSSASTTVQIWNTNSQKTIGSAMKHSSGITSVVFSSDGKKILTAGYDKTARLWDVKSGTQIGLPMEHMKTVSKAVFNPDETQVLTASEDGTARLWDAASGKQIGPSMKHIKAVNSAVFSADGRRIVTASEDSTAQVWNIEGDLDLPSDLFLLQTQVASGTLFDVSTGHLQFVPVDRWNGMKVEYQRKAADHYKLCKYPEYNFWKRFHR